MKELLYIGIAISLLLSLLGCSADDPITEDVYLSNVYGTTANVTSIYAQNGQISDVLFQGDILPASDNSVALGANGTAYSAGWFDRIYIKGELLSTSGNGTAGPPGPQGEKGDTGDNGTQGNQGIQGISGTNGTDGSPGPNLINSSTNTTFTGILTGNGSVVGSVADNSTNWNTAFSWGNHAIAGYDTGGVHTNRTTLDAIQEAFTTALKSSYDWLVSNITSAWKTLVDGHIASTSNPHNVTKAQVGLGAADNTSDVNKPVSTATQTALDGKQATLVSGTNIKTINGSTVLGSGNLVVGGNDPRIIVDAVNGGEQHDVTASTALTKVTVIDIPLTAGTYTFQYYVIYQSNQLTNGIRLAVNYSGTNGAFVWWWRWADVLATASSSAPDQDQIITAGAVQGSFASRAKSSTTRGTTLSVDTINADMLTIIEGVFIATGAGNLELWHGSEVATALYTTSVMPGSSVVVTKTK